VPDAPLVRSFTNTNCNHIRQAMDKANQTFTIPSKNFANEKKKKKKPKKKKTKN
jgi:hypothetical protein